MTEETKTPEPVVEPVVSQYDKTKALIERQEKANEETKTLLERQEALRSEQLLDGKATAGQVKKTPEQTAEEAIDAEVQAALESQRL